MPSVSVESVKRDLRIIHDDDDDLLSGFIESAEIECLNFLNVSELPVYEETSSEPVILPDVARAVRLIVKAAYEETDVTKLSAYRAAAETLLMPYREGLGV